MKIVATITEQDVTPSAPAIDTSDFSHRRAARAVVLNDKGEVALLYVANYKYHKLPGGGIEDEEDITSALDREVMEEIGCEIEVTAEIGQVIEYRDQWRMIQTSYCYLARQVGIQQPTSFTDQEQEHGFEVVWAKDINDAIAKLASDKPEGYDGNRIKPRDLLLLQTAKTSLNL